MWDKVAMLGILCTLGVAMGSKDSSNAMLSTRTGRVLVGGYVPEYRGSAVHWRTLCKHADTIMMFGAEPEADHTLKLHFSKKLMKLAVKSREKVVANSVAKFLLTVGGGGRSRFYDTATSSKRNRGKLVGSILRVIKSNKLDGVDLDWEAPQGNKQIRNYIKLARTLRKRLAPKGQLVTVALHYWQLRQFAQATRSQKGHEQQPWKWTDAFDRINIMLYDMDLPGKHSTLESMVSKVESYLSNGFPASKMSLGIPAYSRGTTRSTASEVKTYSDIRGQHPSLPFDVDEVDGHFFNNLQTVKAKVQWAAKKGIAGVFFWELGQDVHAKSSVETSLFHAAVQESKALAFQKEEL